VWPSKIKNPSQQTTENLSQTRRSEQRQHLDLQAGANGQRQTVGQIVQRRESWEPEIPNRAQWLEILHT
jgi:hypothetical protein